MFTGLVERLAPLAKVIADPPGKTLFVREAGMAADARQGESIAVNGCCLTVAEIEGDLLVFQAGPETLARTNLGDLEADSVVNLERALCVGDRLGGHLVSGHIDGIGRLEERRDEGDWAMLRFSAEPALTRQMVVKGSIAVDGVSLTLNEVARDGFSVALIPHTLAVTTLVRLRVGGTVNLETDLLAKYVEKQLERR